MQALKARFSRIRGEDGLGIVEVLVALMIFMIISVGIAYSAVSSLRLAADSKSRVVAANLAASEIDLARATGDPFQLSSNTRTTVVDGINYEIARTTGWVSASGTSSGCGTGTGALQYKQVNVEVTWPGKLEMTSPVRSNTLVAPLTRLNDPDFGTILVSVLEAAGTGSKGVPVTVSATAGGAAVSISPTDFDGCSYAFKVVPGTYSVTLNKSGFISSEQSVAPTKSIVVKAGETLSAQFSYDKASRFNLKFANNVASSPAIIFPTNLDTTFISTYGSFVSSTGTQSPTIELHPFSSGYRAIAGKYLTPIPANPPKLAIPGCVSPEPSSWAEGTVGGVEMAAGVQSPRAAASPGDSVDLGIPMGVVSIKYTGDNNRYFVAKSAPAANGDPGCDVPMTYIFSGQKLKKGDTYRIALPFGTWSLATASNQAGTGTLTGVLDSLLGGLLNNPSATGTMFTLDPRATK